MKKAYAPEFERYILCVSRKRDNEWYFVFEDEVNNAPYPIVYRSEDLYSKFVWGEWEDE